MSKYIPSQNLRKQNLENIKFNIKLFENYYFRLKKRLVFKILNTQVYKMDFEHIFL